MSAPWVVSFRAQVRPYLLGLDVRNARRSGDKAPLGT